MINEEKLEELELIDQDEFAELGDSDLENVNGGTALNIKKGAFTTRAEAVYYAQEIFKPGHCYRLIDSNKVIRCVSTGAVASGNTWWSVCYYVVNGQTRWATRKSFVCR